MDVTATLNAKLLLVDGCFALVTLIVVCVAFCGPPPPPPPLLPPPHPKVKLNTQSSDKQTAARSLFLPRKVGNRKSRMAPRPEAALSVQQAEALGRVEFAAAMKFMAAKSGCC